MFVPTHRVDQFAQHCSIIAGIANDKLVTNREFYRHALRWAWYESLITLRDDLQSRIDRHEDKLQADVHVFNLRNQMKDL